MPTRLRKARVPRSYNWSVSTAENYTRSCINENAFQHNRFVGELAHIRASRDHAFHGFYSASRQLLQDKIVLHYINKPTLLHRDLAKQQADLVESSDRWSGTKPVIIFTAGAMGSGKSHMLRWISEKFEFPLQKFVVCDIDRIREHLPEMDGYRTRWAPTCGIMTQKESGYIAELLWCLSLERRLPLIIDSSLRDLSYWKSMILGVRRDYNHKICILHVMASPRIIFERVQRRGEQTGRIVPLDLLIETLKTVPENVKKLSRIVDVLATIETSGPEPVLQTAQLIFGDEMRGNVTWESLISAILGEHAQSNNCGSKL